MKAFLAATRSAVRDYLDFAALSECASEIEVIDALLKSDQRYGHLQSASIALDIAKALSSPEPYDLEQVSLNDYKGLVPAWHSWQRIENVCRRFGEWLGERIVIPEDSDEASAS